MSTSVLATDGYKFSMAEAGWPLRTETFYFAHRQGGLQVVPFDLSAEVRRALPRADDGDWAFLAAHDYEMGAAFRAAVTRLHERVQVAAVPAFTPFFSREPIATLTGPSALVSWLEPQVLQWSYRIQLATLALFDPDRLPEAVRTVTCETQRRLVEETLDACGVKTPSIVVDSAGYVARVRERVEELVSIVGSASRLFEVGLRAATCMEQHLLALEGCKQAGLTRTSNVYGARQLGLTPVGTMGHEHVQRYGSDTAAFRAMIDRRFERSSFLLDTFDTITSGLPAAYEIIRERPGAHDSIRYDSGDKVLQYRHAASLAKSMGIRPVQILEDGFDAEQTRRFEQLRVEVGIAPEEQVYGYGGYLVAQTSGTTLTRDRVSAVYKLSQTGQQPTMKFGNEASSGTRCLSGKQSVPGEPVIFRRNGGDGVFGLIGQRGEEAPQGYHRLTHASTPDEARRALHAFTNVSVALSPSTARLAEGLSTTR